MCVRVCVFYVADGKSLWDECDKDNGDLKTVRKLIVGGVNINYQDAEDEAFKDFVCICFIFSIPFAQFMDF